MTKKPKFKSITGLVTKGGEFVGPDGQPLSAEDAATIKVQLKLAREMYEKVADLIRASLNGDGEMQGGAWLAAVQMILCDIIKSAPFEQEERVQMAEEVAKCIIRSIQGVSDQESQAARMMMPDGGRVH